MRFSLAELLAVEMCGAGSLAQFCVDLLAEELYASILEIEASLQSTFALPASSMARMGMT